MLLTEQKTQRSQVFELLEAYWAMHPQLSFPRMIHRILDEYQSKALSDGINRFYSMTDKEFKSFAERLIREES